MSAFVIAGAPSQRVPASSRSNGCCSSRGLWAGRHESRSSARPLRALKDSEEIADGENAPRFRVKEEEGPKKSFFKIPEEKKILTVNDRLERDIRDTASRLGVDVEQEKDAQRRMEAPTASYMDVSTVDPAQALLGSLGSALLFLVCFGLTSNSMTYFEAHENLFGSDVYIVQRLSAVLRTVVLTTFGLGSGLTACTTIGLLLLSIKSFYLRVSGAKPKQK